MRALPISLAISLLALSTQLSFAQGGSWVGKVVLTKTSGIKIGQLDAKGNLEYVGELNDSLQYRVLAERGKQIKVVTTQGMIGWFDKTDAVTLDRAVAHFSTTLIFNPKDADALQKRAYVLETQGKLKDALQDLNDSILAAPTDMSGWSCRAALWMTRKEYDLAIRDYSLAIRFAPDLPYGYSNRGLALLAKKKYDKAIVDFTSAIMRDPKFSYAYTGRGLAWFQKKEYELALKDFDAAEKLHPLNPWLHLYRARLYATSAEARFRDARKAIESAQKALTLEPNGGGEFQEALAAAHAEVGDFAAAIRAQEQAMQDSGLNSDAEAQRRLNLYRKLIPYRQD